MVVGRDDASDEQRSFRVDRIESEVEAVIVEGVRIALENRSAFTEES